MTAHEHDPAVVATGKRVIDTHIFYVNACGCGWLTTGTRSERDDAYSEHLAAAVIDAVADDIARAERERVLWEIETAVELDLDLGALIARLRGGEGRG